MNKEWKRDNSRNTLEMKLAKCTAIYLIPINEPRMSLTERYSAYMCIDGQLEVIWPDFEYRGGEAGAVSESRPLKSQMEGLSMTYTNRRQYPAFHFVKRGCGYSKTSEILNTICEYAGRRIPGFVLTGHSPSPISEQWSAKFDSKEARN